MNRLAWGGVGALVWVLQGCELVAGLQDKYLTGIDGSASGSLDGSTLVRADGSSGDDGPGTAPGDEPPVFASDDAGPIDSATNDPVVDAEPADAAMDAGPTVDLSKTAPDAGATDPSAPCMHQPTYLFCEDFDLGGTVGQNWSYKLTTVDGGALAFDTDAYTSASQSLLVTSPPTSGSPQLVLGEVLSSLNAQFRLAFDIRIDMDSFQTAPITTVAQVLSARQGKTMELDFQLVPPATARLHAFVALDSGVAQDIAFAMPPMRSWTRVVVAYDAGAGLAVYEDGQLVGSTPSGTGAPAGTQFQVGMVYQNPPGSAPIRLELDNVVFRGN